MLLNCFRTSFACPDTNAIVHRQDEDFAIANLTLFARPSGFQDGIDGRLYELVIDGNLKLHLTE